MLVRFWYRLWHLPIASALQIGTVQEGPIWRQKAHQYSKAGTQRGPYLPSERSLSVIVFLDLCEGPQLYLMFDIFKHGSWDGVFLLYLLQALKFTTYQMMSSLMQRLPSSRLACEQRKTIN